MKKLLFALALTAFVGGSAVAHDSDKDKNAKKGEKKECSAEAKASCSKSMAGAGHSCCSKNKTASLITPKAADDKAEKTEAKKASL